MALGRGLASLIPNRRIKNPDEALENGEMEEIDSMEIVEEVAEETTPEAIPAPIGIPVVEEDEDSFDTPIETSSVVEETNEPETIEASQDVLEANPDTPEMTTSSLEEVIDEIEAPEAAQTGIKDSFDDFGQLEGDDEVPLPVKPLVTPLELDPETDAELIDLARHGAPRKEEVHQPKARIAQKAAVEPKVTEKIPAVRKKIGAKKKVEKAEGDDKKWDRHEDQVVHIPIGDININPLQPRRNFDPAEMAELKDSIDQHGILQPLVVARLEDGKYELIAGERRLRAAKDLKWNKIPAVVRRDVASNQTRLVYALIENIQRENLNPVELALAYQQLHDEYGLSHEEIGQRMGKARVSITNTMRILQLPAEVQRGLIEGKISPGHARAILMIPDEEKQVRFYNHLIDEGLTVRKAETRARRIQRTMGVHDPMRNKRRSRHPLANKYSPLLEERFATDANVRFDDEKNRFEVVLKAYSVNEFEQLIGRLLGSVELPDITKDDDVLED